MAKDYYNTLGVSKSASQDEIKAAFRKLAHQYHPDKPGGNAEKFKEINEAYQVIGDPAKRQKYDQFGSAAFDGSAGFGGAGGPFGAGGFDFSGFQGAGFEDLGDMFGEMFGFGGGRRGATRTPRGNDIQVDVDLTFRDAVFGASKEITLTKPTACERCGGVGAEPGTKMIECKDCKGAGVRVVQQRTILGTIQSRVACSTCAGEGESPSQACSTCRGAGLTKQKKTLCVNIPPGVENGNVLRVRAEGEGVKGGQPGDLFVRLHVADDKRFAREGDTIFSQAQIGFTQAALGATLSVETVDGPVELDIPPGTQSGTEFRLRAHGVVTRSGRGDHVVIVEVVTPKKLSKDQRRLLEELDLKE